MTPLAADLLVLFRRDLRCLVREIEAFPDDATLWRCLPGIANSAGNLALHVAGNLRHFIGAVLGNSGYVRQRELEFTTREGARAAVTAQLEAAEREVAAALASLTEAALAAPFPMAVGGHHIHTRRFLLHLSAHLAFHLGQASYLRRALTGHALSTGPMELKDLVDDPEV